MHLMRFVALLYPSFSWEEPYRRVCLLETTLKQLILRVQSLIMSRN